MEPGEKESEGGGGGRRTRRTSTATTIENVERMEEEEEEEEGLREGRGVVSAGLLATVNFYVKDVSMGFQGGRQNFALLEAIS